MVRKKTASKRQTLKQKYKVEKKVKEHHRKLRREARKNPNKSRAVGRSITDLPNLNPMKAKLVNKMKEQTRLLKEHEKLRIARAAEFARRRTTGGDMTALMESATARAAAFEAAAASAGPSAAEGAIASQAAAAAASNRRAFWKHLRTVVQRSDIIFQVLDARDPLSCRSAAVEAFVMGAGATSPKRLVLVLNKIDLVPAEVVQAWRAWLRQYFPTVPFKASTQQNAGKLNAPGGAGVSRAAREGHVVTGTGAAGAENLLQLIKNYSRNHGIKRAVTVGVIGYPNVGKSSLINSLKRSKAASVSPQPGHTKGVQEIQLDSKIKLLDSPGVIFDDKQTLADMHGQASLLLRNCLSVDDLEDPQEAVGSIFARCDPGRLASLYDQPVPEDVNEFLDCIATARGKLSKGGIPNRDAAARALLHDWNSGKIPFYTMPPESSGAGAAVGEAQVVSQWAEEFDIDKMFGDGENAVIEGGPPSAAEIATRHHQFLNLQSGASSGVMDSAAAIAALTADDDDMSDSEEYSDDDDDDMDDEDGMAAEDVAALLNRTSAPRSAGAAKPRAKQPVGTFAMRAEESDEDEDSDARPATNAELLADTAGAAGVGPGTARRQQRAAAKKARKARNRAAGDGEDEADAHAGAAAAAADQPYDFNAYF